ncbi:glucose-6-phosphate dehydrogenase [Nostoc sp. UHCC 0251]|uniref:glucose-6-phosphate dehydrogenase n=1 Tax=Nostoc sp. UHCC 0251 TaxID=3110240 RepID=UPI002B1F554F|nr:glucose-6-phosphate dehydrogenase [Nostoc sp. UHCC 0251]MEA5627571.1 glucose-6-phosphate dehydrogenase [Nostoc sp. UHCC 0251]
MTAINLATDIPSQIDTVEKLAAWCAGILFANFPDMTVIEGVGYSERAAQVGEFWVAADLKTRKIVRLSLHVSADHLSGSGKPWTFVQPLGNTAIPAAFKAN